MNKNKNKNKNKQQVGDYPDNTGGSKIAASVRKQMNTVSSGEKDQKFRKGMALIYGGNSETCETVSR